MVRDLIGRRRGDFYLDFSVTALAELSGLNEPGLVALFLVVALAGLLVVNQARPALARYFVALLVVPLLIMIAARPFDLYARFFAYFLPYLLLLFVVGLDRVWSIRRLVAWRAAALAPVVSGLLLLVVLLNWRAGLPAYVVDEGYRDASQMALAGADAAEPICALGGARSVWRHYVGREVLTPQSLDEFLAIARAAPEVRCVYYEASWQDDRQSQIAQFLRTHGGSAQVGDLVVFTYRAAAGASGLTASVADAGNHFSGQQLDAVKVVRPLL